MFGKLQAHPLLYDIDNRPAPPIINNTNIPLPTHTHTILTTILLLYQVQY